MSFDFETEVAVRYNDVDSYGHVNNAVYATYLEEGRVDYFREILDREDAAAIAEVVDGAGVVVASLELEYERPIRQVEAVTVGVRVPRLGTKSFPVEYEIRTDGEVAATGETTMVAYEREQGRAREIPETWREAITAFEGL